MPRPDRRPRALRLHLAVALLFGAVATAAWEQHQRLQALDATGLRLRRLHALAGKLCAGPAATEPAPSGWGWFFRRLYREIWDDRVLAIAAGVAFYALLAFVPTLAALVSLYGLMADPATISGHLQHLYFFLPEGIVDVIAGQISRIAARPPETLGATLAVSLVLSLWSANAGMKAIFDALNVVHDLVDARSFFRLTFQTLTFTLGAVIFVLLAVASVVVIPVAIDWLGWTAWLERMTILRWPGLALALTAGLAILYRWGPSRPRPASGRRWIGILLAAAVAAIAWVGAAMLFSWYVANFADYDRTYGSLGAAIGFMTWMWLSAIIVLVGGEIDAEIEREAPWA